MRKDIETRAHKGIEVRAAPDDSEFIGVLEGYAAVFGSNSLEFDSFDGPWVERIQPGAFKRTLKERGDVRALWNHDSGTIIARAPNTLDLSEDDKGLRVKISLVDTSVNRDLLANVRAGNVDSMSFGFNVRNDDFDRKKDEPNVRTLTDVDLIEVSAVVWPAYPDTALAVRSVEAFLATDEPEPKPTAPQPSLREQRLRIALTTR